MNPDVLRLIKAFDMIPAGCHVICAVSGGKDSMALLHMLMQLREKLGFRLSAAHFNHQLRGAEADRDEEFVRGWCEQQQLPFFSGRGDVRGYAESAHLSIEDAARTLRYQFLLSIDPDARIATAHTADDNLETLLQHMLRGCSLRGLAGIPPVRDRIIRPLLTTDRRQLAAYLAEYNIPHIEDSTNAEDSCQRNRIRHNILPLLEQENPSAALTVISMCLRLRQEDTFLDALAGQTFEGQDLRRGADISLLRSADEVLAKRFLLKALSEVPEVSASQIDAAYALCFASSPSAVLHLSGDYVLRREYERLVLGRSVHTKSPVPAELLPESGTLRFGCFLITVQEAECPAHFDKDTFALRSGVVYQIRSRLPGDRITLPGGTKKLSRFLVDRKYPAHLRDSVPVITDGIQVAAVLPIAVASPYRPAAGENCLLLTINSLENSSEEFL